MSILYDNLIILFILLFGDIKTISREVFFYQLHHLLKLLVVNYFEGFNVTYQAITISLKNISQVLHYAHVCRTLALHLMYYN
jgi:hypothetical protein